MSLRTFRFRPPKVPIDGAIEWTLVRAFGPVGASVSRPFEPASAVGWARKLVLTSRIASHHDFEDLEKELGSALAREISIERVAIEAQTERLRRTADMIAERAHAAEIPVVFLKFLALELDGLLTAGSRSAADADVLVGRDLAPKLASALAGAGYSVEGLPGSDHQLPILSHPDLAPVEVHVSIPGVRVEGERLATLAALERQRLLTRLDGFPGACHLPSVLLRVAHVLAHGIAHHGFSPADYPMARLFADLIDLGVTGRASVPNLDRAAAWVAGSVAAEEAWAAIDLAGILARGELDGLAGDPDSAARRLLDHLLAGQVDDAYRRGLQLHLVRPGLSDRPAHRDLPRRLWSLVVKSNAELDVVYGPSDSAARRLLLRLFRPFHLLWSLARSVWGRLSARLRA